MSVDAEAESGDSDEIRVWLVERTYGDDELNIVILVYADQAGERYFRKERALTSFTDVRETPVSLVVPGNELGSTAEDDRDRYATEASRMAERHEPDDTI